MAAAVFPKPLTAVCELGGDVRSQQWQQGGQDSGPQGRCPFAQPMVKALISQQAGNVLFSPISRLFIEFQGC